MPWNNGKRIIESRLDFINLVNAQETSVAQLCRDFGISRKTAYKWMESNGDCPHAATTFYKTSKITRKSN